MGISQKDRQYLFDTIASLVFEDSSLVETIVSAIQQGLKNQLSYQNKLSSDLAFGMALLVENQPEAVKKCGLELETALRATLDYYDTAPVAKKIRNILKD